jgi:hypothetical protein
LQIKDESMQPCLLCGTATTMTYLSMNFALVALLVAMTGVSSFTVGHGRGRGFGFMMESGKRTSTSNLSMTILSYNGKKKDFKPGTPLSKALAQLGLKPTYSCKK